MAIVFRLCNLLFLLHLSYTDVRSILSWIVSSWCDILVIKHPLSKNIHSVKTTPSPYSAQIKNNRHTKAVCRVVHLAKNKTLCMQTFFGWHFRAYRRRDPPYVYVYISILKRNFKFPVVSKWVSNILFWKCFFNSAKKLK